MVGPHGVSLRIELKFIEIVIFTCKFIKISDLDFWNKS